MKPTVTILLDDYNQLLESSVPYTKFKQDGKLICEVDLNEIEQMIAEIEETEQEEYSGYAVSKQTEVEVRFINHND